MQTQSNQIWCPSPSTKGQFTPAFNGKTQHAQEIVGTLLYYFWAVDPTLACALSSISTKQTNGTTSVLNEYHQSLDYVATYPHVAISYHASNPMLATYLKLTAKANLGDITSSLNKKAMYPIMVLPSHWQQSSNMLYPVHLKQNLQLSFIII